MMIKKIYIGGTFDLFHYGHVNVFKSLKYHLSKGVLKGALKQDKADEQFQAWLKEKELKISAKQDKISKENAGARQRKGK